jgi:hypothetical protein
MPTVLAEGGPHHRGACICLDPQRFVGTRLAMIFVCGNEAVLNA